MFHIIYLRKLFTVSLAITDTLQNFAPCYVISKYFVSQESQMFLHSLIPSSYRTDADEHAGESKNVNFRKKEKLASENSVKP
jgi:hypothetical protein